MKDYVNGKCFKALSGNGILTFKSPLSLNWGTLVIYKIKEISLIFTCRWSTGGLLCVCYCEKILCINTEECLQHWAITASLSVSKLVFEDFILICNYTEDL